MNSSSNCASCRCSSTQSRLRRSWIHRRQRLVVPAAAQHVEADHAVALADDLLAHELAGHALEPGAHVGSRVERRVVEVEERGDPARRGPLEVEELRRVVPGAPAVGDVVAEHRQRGDAALVARGVPELLGPPRAVRPGDVGAVARRPHVGRAGAEGVVHLDGAARGEGEGAAREERGVGHDADRGDHEVGRHLGSVDLDRPGPAVGTAQDLLDVDAEPHVDAVGPHVLGHERRFLAVEGEREVPVLADQEGDVEAAVVQDLRDLDPDEAAADHHRSRALPGVAVEPFEIAQGDEVVEARARGSRPGSGPGLGAHREQELVVAEAPAVLEDEGVGRGVEAARRGP